MSYFENEQPLVNAIIYYYNNQIPTIAFCEAFFSALKKHSYLDFASISLGKQKIMNGILKDYTVKYGRKQLKDVSLETEVHQWIMDDDITYITFTMKAKNKFSFEITWHKDFEMPDGTKVSDYTYNIINMLCTYDHLSTYSAQENFVNLFCDLADLFDAFYGCIEDVSTSVTILDTTKEKVFTPKRVQAVYWGNYFGEDYMKYLDTAKFFDIPFARLYKTDKGIYFSLTNNISDSLFSPDFSKRKKLFKMLFKR